MFNPNSISAAFSAGRDFFTAKLDHLFRPISTDGTSNTTSTPTSSGIFDFSALFDAFIDGFSQDDKYSRSETSENLKNPFAAFRIASKNAQKIAAFSVATPPPGVLLEAPAERQIYSHDLHTPDKPTKMPTPPKWIAVLTRVPSAHPGNVNSDTSIYGCPGAPTELRIVWRVVSSGITPSN